MSQNRYGYVYVPAPAVELLKRFRERWAGKKPSTNIEWAQLERDRNQVLEALKTPDFMKAMERGGGQRSEYRGFIAELAEGIPAERAVGPVILQGNTAGIGQTDADGYEQQVAQRAANLDAEGGE